MEDQQVETNNGISQTVQEVTSTKTDVMGIVSIIVAFTGFHIAGLIVGLIGASKAKKENYSGTLSKIGWILNLVFMIFSILIIIVVLLAIPALQRNQRNQAAKSDLIIIESEVLNYRSNNNGKIPSSIDKLDLESVPLSGIVQFEVFQYTPYPVGCQNDCTSYKLSVELENGETYESNLE